MRLGSAPCDRHCLLVVVNDVCHRTNSTFANL